MKYFSIMLLTLLLFACSSEAQEVRNEFEDPDAQGDLAFEQVDPDNPDESALEVSAAEDESTESDEDCSVSLSAYISDPDPSGKTNIRKTPGGKVVLVLDKNELEYEEFFLDFIDQKNGWFKMEDKIGGIDEDYEIPGGVGWIHGSVCRVDTRNYGGQELSLFSEPNEEAEKVVSFSNEIDFNIRKVCGDWVKIYGTVDGKKVEGWIQAEWLCGNPLTNCS